MNCKKVKKELLVENRQQEIVKACEELYETMEYEAINIKEIAKSTSICRSNIYNYYETKDEIFLDILKKEYLLWMEDIDKKMEEDKQRDRESYCKIIAQTAEERPRLLKLLSVHYVTIEKNCSLDKLIDFKRAISPFWAQMRNGLTQYFPNASLEKKENFILFTMSLLQGIYSMTDLSEKQIKAMEQINPNYLRPQFKTVFFQALMVLSADLI